MKRERDSNDSLRFLTALAAGESQRVVPVDSDLAPLTIEHRMHGVAMTALENRDDEASQALRRDLAWIDGQTWARHQFLAGELTRVNEMLAAHGIDHYLIKGLAFETRFYQRRGERPSGDLDVVLVDPSSLGEALAILDEGTSDGSVVQQLADDGWIQSVDVTLPSGTAVDLHIDPLKLGFHSHFARSVGSTLDKVPIDNAAIQALDPTGSLVVALLHLNRNRFRYLLGFADVQRIVSGSAVDWGRFDELVRADGLEVVIDGSIRAVCEVLDLDSEDFGGWRPKPSPSLGPRRAIWNLAWRPSTRLAGTAGRFRMGRRSQFLIPALCRGRSIWLFKWMGRRLFPPSTVVDLNHPDISGPYLIRLAVGRWNEISHRRSHLREPQSGPDEERVLEAHD